MSPVMASILLQPCIIEAERAMVEAQGCSLEEFRAVAGIAAYLDDLTIVAHPDVAVVGLRAFAAAVAERGWSVNMETTVCGVGYYATDGAARGVALAEARRVFE
eukprot:COSAG02_NODE_48605_length_332_cov_1.111588_1_plen_103_part_10